ncbi:hypothetical protein CEXT_504141 [Caerostris extrusa]|uniref:Uncharacterized protein n=1 Tax=Caerostris extrusa TaxID=172846 RepID=A0AAV4P0K5_CAEEX|nr:hypothetical protein CEXT_504141 [Caerostris extrusa]
MSCADRKWKIEAISERVFLGQSSVIGNRSEPYGIGEITFYVPRNEKDIPGHLKQNAECDYFTIESDPKPKLRSDGERIKVAVRSKAAS